MGANRPAGDLLDCRHATAAIQRRTCRLAAETRLRRNLASDKKYVAEYKQFGRQVSLRAERRANGRRSRLCRDDHAEIACEACKVESIPSPRCPLFSLGRDGMAFVVHKYHGPLFHWFPRRAESCGFWHLRPAMTPDGVRDKYVCADIRGAPHDQPQGQRRTA